MDAGEKRSIRTPERRRGDWLTLGPLALLVLLAAPAFAQDSAAKRAGQGRAEQGIQADRQKDLARQSEEIQKELAALRRRLVELAEQARSQETELSALEASLARLEEEERAQAIRLNGEQQQIATLLAALQRLSRIPPEVVIAKPGGPVDTLRSALVLRDTVPELRARAAALVVTLQRFADVRGKLEEQRARTLAARADLSQREAEIAGLVARREELSRQTDEERLVIAQTMARLGKQAGGDLRRLMERVEVERRATIASAAKREAERLLAERRNTERRLREQKDAERRSIEQENTESKDAGREDQTQVAVLQQAPDSSVLGNGLLMPVGGRVTTRYGEPDPLGNTSRGMTIAARPGTPILAPSAGSIMFAGPFRGYGQILIVEHSNGYHSLIAGLGRIDTSVGKRVATGEPVGLMPSPADGNPDLYFELRRHGQPINPQRGFSAPEGKGQG